jgi:predicted DNA-binding transcriptional regulator AlpA
VTNEPVDLDQLPALISVPQAAKILGLARASAYRYAAAGDLPVKRLGGRVYVITAKIRPLIDGSEEIAA